MGFKKKWVDNIDNDLRKHLNGMTEIVRPLFDSNGLVNLSILDKKSDLAHLLALILNCKFISSKDKNARMFAADDVIAIQLEIQNFKFLKYWGKIYWLSKPNDHKCFRSYQDPFYGLFKLENNKLEIVEAMFAHDGKIDLDGSHWINSEMNWMYDL